MLSIHPALSLSVACGYASSFSAFCTASTCRETELRGAGQQRTDSRHPVGEVISVTPLDSLTGPDLCNRPRRMSEPMP